MSLLVRSVTVLVTVGLIAVSLMLNFRFGQSLGRTEWDGLIYGVASACADGFKVILPLAVAAAWNAQRRFAGIAGAALWAVFTVYSMTSSLGHSALNRAEAAGSKRHEIATYQDHRRALELKQSEREKLGAFRPADAVAATMSAQRQDWRWDGTGGCNEIKGRTRRMFCDHYRKLEAELATAKRAAELDGELKTLRARLAESPERAASRDSDPQMALLRRLSGLAEEPVRLGLTLLVSVMVELGSGLGLYVVFGHVHDGPSNSTGVPTAAGMPDMPSPEEAWRRVRLVEEEGSHATEIALYRDYCRWVTDHNIGPAMSLGDFRAWLDGERIGERVRKAGRSYVKGVRLYEAQRGMPRRLDHAGAGNSHAVDSDCSTER